MKRSIVLLILGLFSAPLLSAQTGNYFLTNLSPPDENIDPRSLGIAQDQHGVIYFTNKSGILEFDGINWRLIPTPGTVYTILSSGTEIFAGGSFGFGKLISISGSASHFELISDKKDIFSSILVNGNIFFCNENEILTYSLQANGLVPSKLTSSDINPFEGLFVIGNKPFVSTGQTFLQEIKGDALVAPEFVLPAGQHLLFSLSFTNSDEGLLGTEEGIIFRFKSPGLISPMVLTDAELLDHQVLMNGTLVSNGLLALGTLRGGVIFIDVNSGATKEIIDYNMGLPDNEVATLFTDRNKGVWAAHEYGFSRIAPFLPFRSFNHYPGLSGNLLCVREIDGKLFAGTSLGLYYLKNEEKYEDVEIIEKPAKVVASVDQKKEEAPVDPIDPPVKPKKKLFDFLRSKKNKKGEWPKPVVVTTENPTVQPQPIKRRTKKILLSSQFKFEKIDGIEGKVTQLLEVNGKTIVAGLAGVHMLNGLKAQPMFLDPVRYVHHSLSLNQLFISTYNERTVSLALANNIWRETHYADTLNDYISYIFEDELNNIWFCGSSLVYKMTLKDGTILSMEALPIANPMFGETVGLAMGGEVYVVASRTFLRYDHSKGFVKNDSLPAPNKYYASVRNFWFSNGQRWHTFNNQLKDFKLEWLALFPNLRFLRPTNDESGVWLVTANNELYKFTNPINEAPEIVYPLFLKDVRGDKVKAREGKSLRIEQSENGFEFEFTQPSYTGNATQFRYRLSGLSKEWSSWSSDNNIPFSFLPPGEYELNVQSRDVFGNESKVESVSFEVLPPYWKRWWFYALEFTFFTILVIISIKLGRGDERYRVVSQVLSLLTVIMLIQFIETGINSFFEFRSSPVIQFFVQLGIALVIFPLEGRLQKFMRFASGLKIDTGIAPN